MNRWCIFIGVVVCSWLGWWLGGFYSLTAAYLASIAGSLAGVWLGWWCNRRFFA